MTEMMEVPPDPQECRGPDEPEAIVPRVAGLNRGQIWVREDFDAPLPDEFWLGDQQAQLSSTFRVREQKALNG